MLVRLNLKGSMRNLIRSYWLQTNMTVDETKVPKKVTLDLSVIVFMFIRTTTELPNVAPI